MTNATAAAMARAAAITGSPQAARRKALAHSLAFDPAHASLSVPAAIRLLAAAPEEQPGAAAPASEGRPATTGGLSPAEATAAWDRAVARVNRRVEGRSPLARA